MAMDHLLFWAVLIWMILLLALAALAVRALLRDDHSSGSETSSAQDDAPDPKR